MAHFAHSNYLASIRKRKEYVFIKKTIKRLKPYVVSALIFMIIINFILSIAIFSRTFPLPKGKKDTQIRIAQCLNFYSKRNDVGRRYLTETPEKIAEILADDFYFGARKTKKGGGK